MIYAAADLHIRVIEIKYAKPAACNQQISSFYTKTQTLIRIFQNAQIIFNINLPVPDHRHTGQAINGFLWNTEGLSQTNAPAGKTGIFGFFLL